MLAAFYSLTCTASLARPQLARGKGPARKRCVLLILTVAAILACIDGALSNFDAVQLARGAQGIVRLVANLDGWRNEQAARLAGTASGILAKGISDPLLLILKHGASPQEALDGSFLVANATRMAGLQERLIDASVRVNQLVGIVGAIDEGLADDLSKATAGVMSKLEMPLRALQSSTFLTDMLPIVGNDAKSLSPESIRSLIASRLEGLSSPLGRKIEGLKAASARIAKIVTVWERARFVAVAATILALAAVLLFVTFVAFSVDKPARSQDRRVVVAVASVCLFPLAVLHLLHLVVGAGLGIACDGVVAEAAQGATASPILDGGRARQNIILYTLEDGATSLTARQVYSMAAECAAGGTDIVGAVYLLLQEGSSASLLLPFASLSRHKASTPGGMGGLRLTIESTNLDLPLKRERRGDGSERVSMEVSGAIASAVRGILSEDGGAGQRSVREACEHVQGAIQPWQEAIGSINVEAIVKSLQAVSLGASVLLAVLQRPLKGGSVAPRVEEDGFAAAVGGLVDDLQEISKAIPSVQAVLSAALQLAKRGAASPSLLAPLLTEVAQQSLAGVDESLLSCTAIGADIVSIVEDVCPADGTAAAAGGYQGLFGAFFLLSLMVAWMVVVVALKGVAAE